ncbi:MAG TPA: HlyD family efflux transporter periplasmic adaptor subunit [Candidatus Acidoferrales bacterium]|nr:HlyD family efflux transporter periplasmic adaptor subunit [Candidatus Acidoferrales bacterium]
MPRKIIPIVVVAAIVAGAVWYLRRDNGPRHFTGFVEGEERVIRSEVSGRVLEVRFAEGAKVPANEVLAVLDDRDIAARLQSKQEEIDVLQADIRTQEDRVTLTEATWKHDVNVHNADVRQAESASVLAQRTLAREQELAKTGASTAQQLDDNRSRRQQADSALDAAKQTLARTEAQERQITVARNELASMKQRLELLHSQLEELQVTHAKYTIRAPSTETVVQTQLIWPGELAQPGAAIAAVLDPRDKYVQIYIPVADLDSLHVGSKVDIELDSQPGRRSPGEVSFIADKANFTPEKIETRSDRVGQVYRVKVRILKDVEGFLPGTEGNVYLLGDPPHGA